MSELAGRSLGLGLQGHLNLTCALDANGVSHLKAQSFSAPFHLSKPYRENGVLVVNVVNPTSGFFQGDTARSEIHLETGARLLLTQPSATRVHNTQRGGSQVVQNFKVETGGWLEVLPELFIPHRGARHEQQTRIELQRAAELYYVETFAPGRVASGESFAFDQLSWATDILYDGRLIARERFALTPGTPSTITLQKLPYFATLFVVTENLVGDSSCWQEIRDLHAGALWTGVSPLVEAGWVVKILAANSLVLRDALKAIRQSVYRSAKWPRLEIRKI